MIAHCVRSKVLKVRTKKKNTTTCNLVSYSIEVLGIKIERKNKRYFTVLLPGFVGSARYYNLCRIHA